MSTASTAVGVHDVHSLASLHEIRPVSLHLDWKIDWPTKRIQGSVTHELEVLADVMHATFDTSYLAIGDVTVDGEVVDDVALRPRQGPLGEPLVVGLGGMRRAGERVTVQIQYATTDRCTALGWLAADQTRGKTTPFLYSQCQAIHARSLLPCFDSPSRKVTYTARVSSDIPVLMSALTVTSSDLSVHQFEQPLPIPTYLIAIVGGELTFRSLGPRTGVWSEPSDADAVQWEFEADAERFLAEAERLVSPYAWTRYDSVVLPPSFPYGGMENANLTTLTPTLVSGDRSSTDVLLHELCHSWSGNLVSCANWESFWLNEGWTVYLERLLLERVHAHDNGPAHRGFSYIIGAKALRDSLEGFAHVPRFQRLIPEYRDGEDPDDAFSSIPYEKGSNFLLYLERVVGGLAVFEPYVRAYFTEFAGRSITTDDWRAHLYAFYADNAAVTAALDAVDWNTWLHGEGVSLPVEMAYDDTLARDAVDLAHRWQRAVAARTPRSEGKFGADDIAHWNANQVVVFLEALHAGPPVPAEAAQWLDDVYGLNQARNTEVLLRFYEVALEDARSAYTHSAAAWVRSTDRSLTQVATQGRMKYCRTVYKALYRVAPELARQTFSEHRHFYHPIAAALIAKVRTPGSFTDRRTWSCRVVLTVGHGHSAAPPRRGAAAGETAGRRRDRQHRHGQVAARCRARRARCRHRPRRRGNLGGQHADVPGSRRDHKQSRRRRDTRRAAPSHELFARRRRIRHHAVRR